MPELDKEPSTQGEYHFVMDPAEAAVALEALAKEAQNAIEHGSGREAYMAFRTAASIAADIEEEMFMNGSKTVATDSD